MEAAHPVHIGRAPGDALRHLDVAVARLRPRRFDPQGHQRIGPRREAARGPESAPERRAAVDDVIGRHDGHDGVGSRAAIHSAANAMQGAVLRPIGSMRT